MSGKGSSDICFEERVVIQSMLEKGEKTGTIASTLLRSHSGIKTEIKKNGGRDKYNASFAHERYQARQDAKNRKVSKNFNEQEINLIKEAINQGLSKNKISELTGISFFRISRYFKENAVKYKAKNYTAFDGRIEALEMQIEIITDELRRLNDKLTKNK